MRYISWSKAFIYLQDGERYDIWSLVLWSSLRCFLTWSIQNQFGAGAFQWIYYSLVLWPTSVFGREWFVTFAFFLFREDFSLLSALNPQRLMLFLEGLYTELSFLLLCFLFWSRRRFDSGVLDYYFYIWTLFSFQQPPWISCLWWWGWCCGIFWYENEIICC